MPSSSLPDPHPLDSAGRLLDGESRIRLGAAQPLRATHAGLPGERMSKYVHVVYDVWLLGEHT